MSIQELTYRVARLRGNFDPTNPEHVAELKAIQEALQPMLDSLTEWMADKVMIFTMKENPFSSN